MLIAALRQRRLRQRIADRDALFSSPADAPGRQAIQLKLWNTEWQRIVERVPYYRVLAAERNLPREFSSWAQFSELVPAVTRSQIRTHRSEMCDSTQPPDFFRITGGSTAEPVQLPAWKSEHSLCEPDMWLGRSWYGISPASRLFLLWGHSHLLGSGWRGRINACKRELFDHLLGYRRFSAYDLRRERLREAADVMLRFRPEYIIGYSVALDLFAAANQDNAGALRSLGVKMVVGAAEGFPNPESKQRLSDLFDAPVAMEYGSVESNLVAHIHPDGGYRVFWRTYAVEYEPSSTGRGLLRITSLYPRCFPLVRYELGDEVTGVAPDRGTCLLYDFPEVAGRCNDYVALEDGSRVHSEVFTHAVRGCGNILGYQVVQQDLVIDLNLRADTSVNPSDIDSIRQKLLRANPGLVQVRINVVSQLQRTVAGKTPMVIRKNSKEGTE